MRSIGEFRGEHVKLFWLARAGFAIIFVSNSLDEIMQRLLSTYLFISRKLTPELLGQVAGNGFHGVEIFCARSHFEYSMKPEIKAMASALEGH